MNNFFKIFFTLFIIYTAYDIYNKQFKNKKNIQNVVEDFNTKTKDLDQFPKAPPASSMKTKERIKIVESAPVNHENNPPVEITMVETPEETSYEEDYPPQYKDQITSNSLVSCRTLPENCEPNASFGFPKERTYNEDGTPSQTICVSYVYHCLDKKSVQGVFNEDDIFKEEDYLKYQNNQ